MSTIISSTMITIETLLHACLNACLKPGAKTDLFIEGVERELGSVVCAAQGGHIPPHHAGVGLAIILTVPLTILLHNLQTHSSLRT